MCGIVHCPCDLITRVAVSCPVLHHLFLPLLFSFSPPPPSSSSSSSSFSSSYFDVVVVVVDYLLKKETKERNINAET